MISDTYSEKSDVYSFGIILWEVMSRKKPFANMDHQKIKEEVFKGKKYNHVSSSLITLISIGSRPDLNDANIFENSDPIKDVISKCWHSDPHNRPTMKDLIVSLGHLLPSA